MQPEEGGLGQIVRENRLPDHRPQVGVDRLHERLKEGVHRRRLPLPDALQSGLVEVSPQRIAPFRLARGIV